MQILSDRSGNFGIITALIMVPLIGVVGLAIDFAAALDMKSQLYAAADAAAIGAVAEKSNAVRAAMLMTSDGSVALGKDEANQLFNSQMTRETRVIPVDLSIDVQRVSNKIQSVVRFKASLPTTFMQVLGQPSFDIAGVATAEYQTASFMDFHILIDNTPSMGVGATPTDVALMEKNTSDSCAFACHELENAKNYYDLAKKLKVQMRIDVVRQATKALTETAKQQRTSDNQFRMGVYTFGDKAEDAKLKVISDLSDDLGKVATFTDAVDLMTIPRQGYNNDQQTSFDSALTQMNTIIEMPGSGVSAGAPEKILFFVSDGVGDSSKPKTCTKKTTGDRCQEPIDTSFCKPLKDRGVKIAVLYTTYLPLPKNSWYNTWIKPFQSEIPSRMQACATPGFFFEVTPTQGISDAMNALFLKIIHAPRLTG